MELTPEQAREYVQHIASEYAALVRPEFEKSAEFRRQMAVKFPTLVESNTAAALVFEAILATFDDVPVETMARAATACCREAYPSTIAELMRETGDRFQPTTATEFFDELLIRMKQKEAN